MFDFIYQCFGIKKRKKVKWIVGEEDLLCTSERTKQNNFLFRGHLS